MKATLVVLTAILGIVLPAHALDIKAITAKPTADNPQCDNKKAWPMLVGDEYFQKQKWPKARLLIWSRPGEKSNRRGPKIDPMNPASWIDAATGKPADAIPDMDTDIIIPDADKSYAVAMRVKSYACRHLTIGRNGAFSVEGGGNFSIFGNLWIRNNGMLTSWRNMTFAGNRDTFLRQDWPEDGKLKKLHDERLVSPYDPKEKTPFWMQDGRKHRSITTYMVHDKPSGKSTEMLGYVRILDEVGIKSGTFIVGRDSRFVSMGPSSVSVQRGAKVVLMDGAQGSHGQNQFVNRDWGVARGAAVTGGTPDRPLKRDAYFGVGYRNWMNLPVPEPKNSKKKPKQQAGPKRYYGYDGHNARIDGDLIGYPAPGSDARLVVCWQRISSGGAGNWGRRDEAFKKVFPKIVPKISIWFGPAARVANVRFDDLHRGGIVTPSADVFRKWKNVTFGDACLSKDPKELIRENKSGKPLPPEKKYTSM
ncbi:MAG: hypothetical protein ACYSU0_15685 [Planctomycetota bacterium]|jgi:hypothetical protein